MVWSGNSPPGYPLYILVDCDMVENARLYASGQVPQREGMYRLPMQTWSMVQEIPEAR